MKYKAIFFIATLLFCALTASAQEFSAASKADNKDAEARKAAFDKVWNTINEKHFDSTFGGVNWQKIRETYEPKVAKANSLSEFHAVLNQMLGELKLSHFGVFMPAPEVAPTEIKRGTTGIKIKMIDSKPVVLSLPDSSAQSGLKKGFIIEKVGEKTVAEWLAPLEKHFGERKVSENEKNMARQQALEYRLDGDAATKIKVEALDARNARRVFEIERFERKAEMSQPLGNLPAMETTFEAKRLENGIGYIRFSPWVVSLLPKIREAIISMNDAPGIIFDVRGNPGGVVVIANGITGLMVREQTSLGTMRGRSSENKLIVYPQKNPFAGKVVVLTDGGSGSTSEVFAAALQDLGRATVVGERSAGMILVSVFEKLPTGALFQYAISDYKSPKNVLIEGRGVIPDIEVLQTRKALLEGRDLQLEKAINLIKEKR